MSEKNDAVIMGLKAQIAGKKASLGTSQRFVPVTNCSLEVDGVRYNLHTLSKDIIIALLVKLTSYNETAKALKYEEDYTLSGFLVKDWIKDLQGKLAQLIRNEEEKTLHAWERKLETLMSEDKRVELELQEIMKGLGQ